jgi:6-bladed beta-propeller
MSKKTGWIVIILCLAFLTSCKGATAWKGSFETVDGVRVVRNPYAPMYPEGALSLQEDLTIGTAEGAEEYMFIRLRWLFVDESGSIYTLDQRKPRIDVFDSDGRHVRSIGRQGQGPGEFQTPFFIALSPPGEILVGEMGRLSFFDRSGGFLRSQNNSVGPLAFVKYLANGDAVGTRMVLEEEKPRYEVVLCGPDLQQKQVLTSSAMPDPSAKFALFTSVVRWDISAGREIICASGDGDYLINVYDGGGRLIRKILRDHDPVPVSDADIDRQMKQHGFQSRDEFTSPRYLPPISWVYADDEGRIYVSTWQRDPESGIALFNIFDPEGRYLCDYRIPGEPLVIKNGKLYAIVQDNEGIQYVKRYRMTWKRTKDTKEYRMISKD